MKTTFTIADIMILLSTILFHINIANYFFYKIKKTNNNKEKKENGK